MTQRAKNEIDPINTVVAPGQTPPYGAIRPGLRLELARDEAHLNAAKCHADWMVVLDQCYCGALTIDQHMEGGNRMTRTKQRQFDRRPFGLCLIAQSSARLKEEAK